MISTLLLRLEGPMQAWGVQSRFEIRDTGTEPSKSGVIGLVCAALGRDRSESIADVAALRMGVRIDREGQMRRDYQTTVRWKWDRRSGRWKESGTTLSERYFLADASFLVGLEGEDRSLLETIDSALDHPRWPLVLGRRSCPPSRPVRIVDGLLNLPLEEALATADRLSVEKLSHDDERSRCRTVIEHRGGAAPGIALLRRPDQPVSFDPRRFAMREVVVDFVPQPASQEEVTDVSQ